MIAKTAEVPQAQKPEQFKVTFRQEPKKEMGTMKAVADRAA